MRLLIVIFTHCAVCLKCLTRSWKKTTRRTRQLVFKEHHHTFELCTHQYSQYHKSLADSRRRELDIWTYDNWILDNWTLDNWTLRQLNFCTFELLTTECLDNWTFGNWTSRRQLDLNSDVQKFSCPGVQLSRVQLSWNLVVKSSVV